MRTLYGDAGYDTEGTVSMWPYPHEALIKSQMSAYSGTDSAGTVSGNRGFASTTATQLNGQPVTLTSYIWEYLGNPIPADIYGITSTPVTTPTIAAPTISGSPVTSATVGVAYSFTPTASNASSFNIIGGSFRQV